MYILCHCIGDAQGLAVRAGDAARLLAGEGEHMVTMTDALGRKFDCKLPSTPANATGTSDEQSSEVLEQFLVPGCGRMHLGLGASSRCSVCCCVQGDESAKSPTELLDRMGTT